MRSMVIWQSRLRSRLENQRSSWSAWPNTLGQAAVSSSVNSSHVGFPGSGDVVPVSVSPSWVQTLVGIQSKAWTCPSA